MLTSLIVLIAWAAERCRAHGRFWSQDQTVWHYFIGNHSIVEFPMEEEYLIDNLKAFSQDRKSLTAWIESYKKTTILSNMQTLVTNETETKEHRPTIYLSVNDPINATSRVELTSKYRVAFV